ncbi:MAG: hypothetical protein M1823_003874 [Watsoniomyces obsoletus]|nr:MAG: hypothetical protein M1823_003874 [Watsoniomyces obsoletus]
MDSSHLRRKDTTKGPPLRVLSLDGGGVRGYSMLILLQELMYRTYVECEGKAPRREQIPKPCDHFDLIAGTGTGGLIALMLGRLRLDLETCKDVYVRMTRRVFETDKTFAGIPYRSTLFKASKLEEAIRECVAEHTASEQEGGNNDDSFASPPPSTLMSPLSPMTPASAFTGPGAASPRRTLSRASVTSGMSSAPSFRYSMVPMRRGNPNAPLYDTRENRTKTAVTAIYRGTPKNGSPVFLRSYDSRREPPPEFNCTIWQAGRATCATGLAFKPIQIGQSVFHDEGAGKYNPAPQVLDEAAINEWPGREVGVFVSIGTGKRPAGTSEKQHLWWEDFLAGGMGDFAEARRRLIAKIEDCEVIHQYMMKEHLSKRGVNAENYYRLNVEVGVGEFGMNEWNRLADISTNTRRYLARGDTQNIIIGAASKMARIQLAKMRLEARASGLPSRPSMEEAGGYEYSEQSELAHPLAVELPGSSIQLPDRYAYPPPLPTTASGAVGAAPSLTTTTTTTPYYNQQLLSPQEKFTVISPSTPAAPPPPPYPRPPQRNNMTTTPPPRRSHELAAPRTSNEFHSPARSSVGSFVPPSSSPRRSGEYDRVRPGTGTSGSGIGAGNPSITTTAFSNSTTHLPPLPPKTPLPYPDDEGNIRNVSGNASQNGNERSSKRPQSPSSPLRGPRSPNGYAAPIPPYPDTDGPPPVVNLARKPEFRGS